MKNIKADILKHEEGLKEGFYKNFDTYTGNLNSFRGSLIAFSGGLIAFLIFFIKDTQDPSTIIDVFIVLLILINFICSILLGVVFPILQLKICLYRDMLYNSFIFIVRKTKYIINYDQDNFNQDNIEEYKKAYLEFQYKNNNLPWYYNFFIFLENIVILFFMISLIFLLILLSYYFINLIFYKSI